MATKQDEVITLSDDRRDIEYNIWVEVFGKEKADEMKANLKGKKREPLDKELQEIVDNAPALDEIK